MSADTRVRSLEFRRITEDDIDTVQTLFHKVFGRPRPRSYYLWQYKHAFPGNILSAGTWIGDELVAHVGYTGREFRWEGRDVLVLSNHDVMSDPDHRGIGAFRRLTEWGVRSFVDSDFDLVLTHPNTNAHPVQSQVEKYADLSLLPCVTADFSQMGKSAMSFSADDRFRPFYQLSDEYLPLCDAVLGQLRFGLKRSIRYLNWRYHRHPMEKYYILEHRQAGVLRSAVVFKFYPMETPDRINILEWFCTPEDKSAAIAPVQELVDFAKEHYLKILIWHSMHDKPRYTWLQRLGFRPDLPLFNFGIFLLRDWRPSDRILDFRHWYTTMGDHDVF